MNNPKPNKKIETGPVTVSILLHVIVLLVLAFLKFSQSPPQKSRPATAAAKITAVKKLIQKPQILPKPKIITATTNLAALVPNLKTTPKNKPALLKNKTEYKNSELVSKEISYDKLRQKKTDIEFFGNTVTAARLCFVVDCSGSMKGVFEKVKTQLKNSILPLEPDNYFEIIFFGNNRLYSFGKNRLQRASGPAKQEAIKFIEQTEPAGKTNATEALTAAIKCKDPGGNSPDVIYFLTDGFELDSQNNTNFLENIMALRDNYCRQTKINTIGFWPKTKDRIILTQMSLVTGGSFKTAEK